MDLNAGLTQLLDDGTNTYLYGNARLAQINTGTQYFLGDVLGSVRQMADASGDVTFAQSYDPYGVVLGTSHTALGTPYGFTAEQTDPTGMIYLRARYYAPEMGRFMSRDTWGGNVNSPLSYNKWIYTEVNPINRTDPSGLMPSGPRTSCSYDRLDLNAEYVEEQVHNLSKSYWLDTYTAAGLAVQCWATVLDGTPDYPMWRPNGVNDSWGPAQISYTQAETPMGGPLSDDLRCYVYKTIFDRSFIRSDIGCLCGSIPTQIQYYFKLEPTLDPLKWDDAATLMQRRIVHALNTCNDCRETDKYIMAAMAQNGPGFTGMADKPSIPNNKREIPRLATPTKDRIYDWEYYYNHAQYKNTGEQLSRFTSAISGFKVRNWTLPNIDTAYINKLK